VEAPGHALHGHAAADADRVGPAARQEQEMQAFQQQCRYRLTQLLGQDGVERLQRLRRRPYERASGVPPQPGSPKDVHARKLDQHRRKHELLSDLCIHPEDLRSLSREMRDKITGSIPLPPMRDRVLQTFIRPLDIAPDIAEGNPRTTFVARPPYSDWSWYYDGWHNGSHFEPTLFPDSNSGLVGCRNYLWDNDALDFDHAQIEYNASIGFWYQMPANARLDIYVEAWADITTHHLGVIDEWEDSDVFSR
jgi:hypothetical protein